MKTTPLMLTAALVLTGCLEPNRYAGADPTEEAEAESGDPADGDDGEDEEETDGDDSDDDSDGDAGDETGGSQEPGCDPETHKCVDFVPVGWEGPIRVADASESCEGDYGFEVLTVHEDVAADPAVCSCECEAPSGGECSVEVTDYPEMCFWDECSNVDACETPVATVELTTVIDLGYVSTAAMGVDASFIVSPPTLTSAGECGADPTSSTEHLPGVELEGARRLCALDGSIDVCNDGSLCVPGGDEDVYEPGVCIWKHGNVACPDGGFTERTVLFDSVHDDRGCGECECSEVTGADCSDARISVWTFPGGEWADFPPDGGCHTVSVPSTQYIDTLHLEPPRPTGGSCEATRESYGSVQAEGEVTICCTAQ